MSAATRGWIAGLASIAGLLGGCYSSPALPEFGAGGSPGPAVSLAEGAAAVSESEARAGVEAAAPAPGRTTAALLAEDELDLSSAAAGADEAEGAGASGAAGLAETVLGRVGAMQLTAADLIESLNHRQGDVLRGEINRAIGERLALQEAARIELRLDPREVDAATSRHLGEFAREVVPEGVELEEFVRDVMERDPARFRAALRRDTLGEMVLERVVRADTLGRSHARVRILVADDEGAEAAFERWQAGEDFEALVRELSRDPSAERGGLVPFLIDAPQSPLAQLAFATPVGEVGGPLPSGSPGRPGPSVLVSVEQRPDPIGGDWSAVGEAVEASLAEHPVAEEEFLVWQIQMEQRYQVDLGPLLELMDG